MPSTSTTTTKKTSSVISDETMASTASESGSESATDTANALKKVFSQKVDGGKKSAWAMTLEVRTLRSIGIHLLALV